MMTKYYAVYLSSMGPNPRLFSDLVPYSDDDPRPDLLVPVNGRKEFYVDLFSKFSFDHNNEINALKAVSSVINGAIYRASTGAIEVSVPGLCDFISILRTIVVGNKDVGGWKTVNKNRAKRYLSKMMHKLARNDMVGVYDPVLQFLPLVFVIDLTIYGWNQDLQSNFTLNFEKRKPGVTKCRMVENYFLLFDHLNAS